MSRSTRCIALAAALSLMGSVCGFTQEQVKLSHRTQAGQVFHRKSTNTVHLDVGGQKVDLEITQTDKVTVKEVSPAGDITMEVERESQDTTANGLKTTSDVSKIGKRTIVIHPDGTLVSYKGPDSDKPATPDKPDSAAKPVADKKPDGGKKPTPSKDAATPAGAADKASADKTAADKAAADKVATDKAAADKAAADKAAADKAAAEALEALKADARLYPMAEPIYPDKAVQIGDKWSRDYPANAETGLRAAHADFEVMGFEKDGDTETVRVRMAYRETDAGPAVTATSTIWVDKTLGNAVAADSDVTNVPFQMGATKMLAAGNVHTERVDGKKDKRIAEIVKDYDKLPGVIALYRKQEDGKDSIYAELRQDQLEKLMMIEVTASTGTSGFPGPVAGDPLSDVIFRFTRTPDDRIVMTVPNISFRASKDKPIARAVQRSFAEGYVQSFKIEAEDKAAKTVLINVSDIFKSDFMHLTGSGSGYSLDKEKTYITKLANFPENLVVETQYHFASAGGGSAMGGLFGGSTLADPSSAPFRVTYNLFPLPDNGYKPRLADGRVGYFTTDYQTFDRDDKNDLMVHYIYRWQMEKADPSAAMSPPKKPIVFWLDNAIPLEYRAAVRDGLLLWNKGFEGIGIKDAIVVKQMPDDADWDHSDMRYNTIRWVASPDSGYAVALFRVNPITGQILNANITVDSNLVRYTKIEHQALVEPSVAFDAGAGLTAPWMASLVARPGSRDPRDPRYCTLADGAVQQAWFGHTALQMLGAAGAKVNEADYINSFLHEVVGHEMGHIMGLRHNFIASTEFSLDQLKDPSIVRQHGTAASLMDYMPFNLSSLRSPGVDYFSQTIGDYDKWAIAYGYTTVPNSSTPEAEVPQLSRIASQSGLPGHAYQSDEIADDFDPSVTRFDLSADPLEYWTRMLRTSRYLLVHLDERLPKKGESYWEFTRSFNQLLNVYARAAGTASRFVGGMNVNRNFKGDANEKPTLAPVPADKQKEALSLLNTYVFSPSAFAFPARYFTRFTVNPTGGFMDSLVGPNPEFPIYDQIASIQRAALRRVFQPIVLQRIANNEYKMGGDPQQALTMPSVFHTVGATVWSELEGKGNIPPLRRQLQRAHLDQMIAMAVSPSAGSLADARMLAWDQLRTLQKELRSAQARGGHDGYTRLHLEESLTRVNRALTAHFVVSQAS